MRSRFADRLEFLALALACVTLMWGPLAQGSTFGWGMSGLIALGCTTFTITLLALSVRGQLRVSNPWWMGAAIAFLAWVWASTHWAPYKWEALRWAGVWTAVVGTAMCLHLFATIKRRQMAVLIVMLLTGAAALGLAYLQTRGVFIPGFEYYPGAGIRVVTGPYFNPSHFSGFLIPLAALLTSLIMLTRLHVHTFVLIGLLVMLHSLNLKTDSSSIPAVLLATGLPLLVWVWTKSKRLGGILTGLLIGTAVVGTVLFLQPQGQVMFENYKSQLGLRNEWDRFLSARRAVWRYGEEMWADHFFSGAGVGQFTTEAQRYRAPERQSMERMDRASVNYAHSDLLQVGSELGVVGTVLFMLILILPFAGSGWQFTTFVWIAASISLGFAGVYDAHSTAIPGTSIAVFGCCGLASSRFCKERN